MEQSVKSGMMIRIMLGLGISGILVFLILQKISWEAVLSSFRLLSSQWLAVAIILQFCSYFVRAVRWKILQFPGTSVASSGLFSILSISYMLNSILPLRLGDIARALLCSQRLLVSKTQSFAFLILEKLADAIIIFTLLLCMMLFISMPESIAQLARILGLALLAILCLLILLITVKDKLKTQLVKWRQNKLCVPVLGMIDRMQDVSFEPGNIALVMMLSVFIWLIEAVGYYFIGIAFGFPWSYDAAIFLMATVNLATMIPSSPGYIGTFQYFAILALGIVGIPVDLAAAYAIIAHPAIFLPITFIGFGYFLASGLSLSKLRT